MNLDDDELVHFYNNRLAAHRQLYTPRETLLEKLHWTGWGISVLVLVITLLYRVYGRETTLGAVVTSAGGLLLETLTFIVPARLLFALDGWMNPLLAPMSESEAANTHAAKGEAMRRIIGLGRPGGMMASVLQARSRALSATSGVFGIQAQSDRPPGLGNIDNSCYQNSILQGLAALDSMPAFLSTCLQNLDAEQSNSSSVAQTLKTLISDLNDLSNNGQTLWTPRILKSMSTWTQQDAQEYYSKILDDIDKGVAKAVRESRPRRGLEGGDSTQPKDDATASQHSEDSGYQSATPDTRLSDMKLLRNPLEGLLAQRVACIRCGHSDGISMIPFNCLTLSLGLDKHQHDLYERLDAYTKVEAIEGVECPKCTLLKTQTLLQSLVGKMEEKNMPEEQVAEQKRRLAAVNLALEEDDFDEKTVHGTCKISPKSKVTTTKTKQIVIGRPPQSLVVHMNRSVFDPTTFDMIKNSAPVQFPMTLDLGPWCLGSSSNAGGGGGKGVEGEELWPTGKMASLIAGDASPSRLSGPIYELRAAVTHYGRHENGHYICYRKYPRSAPCSEVTSEAEADDANEAEAAESTNEADAAEDTNEAKVQTEPEQTAENTSLTNKAAEAAEDGSSEISEKKADADEDVQSEDVDSDGDGEALNATPPREKATSPPTWWRLSDHNVSKVDDETVLSLSPGVFMLFYECVDPSMVLDAEEDEMQDAASSLGNSVHQLDTSLGGSPPVHAGAAAEYDDAGRMTRAVSVATTETTGTETETETDARSDSSATETDNTTVGSAESMSLPDSEVEEEDEGRAKH